MLGLPSQATEQAELYRENEEHQDLVQGNFIDTYYNLTFKSVMGSYMLNDPENSQSDNSQVTSG